MVMAEKQYPAGLGEFVDDVKELFRKEKPKEDAGKPGSEQPAPGKCGCHPGGIHHEDSPADVEQRNVDLVAIPVKVDTIVDVRALPAKRAGMRTVYPGTTPNTAILVHAKDPKLKHLILQAGQQPVWIGPMKVLANMGAGATSTGAEGAFQLSAGQPTPPWEGVDEDLYCMAVFSGSVLSIRSEYWPDI